MVDHNNMKDKYQMSFLESLWDIFKEAVTSLNPYVLLKHPPRDFPQTVCWFGLLLIQVMIILGIISVIAITFFA